MEWNVGTVFKVVVAAIAAVWGGLEPMVQLLIALMAMDIVTGVLVAGMNKALDSSQAFRGMFKKALILCLVVIGLLIEYYSRSSIPGMDNINLPISEAIAGFFAASEGISCVENAAAAGIPIPQFLRDALAKLSPENKP